METAQVNLHHVDTLADLFPTYPRSELAARLLCSDNLDTLVDQLFSEQAQKQKRAELPVRYSLDVYRLQELFPKKLLDELQNALQQNRNDLNKTMDMLMNPEPIDELVRLTGIDADAARPFLKGDDIPRAVVEIICNYQKKAWTSRVQSRGQKQIYVYREGSKEAVELRECLEANPRLQLLDATFLQKSLCFYEGDVIRVLEVAHMIANAQRENLTFVGANVEKGRTEKNAADVLRAGLKYNVPVKLNWEKPKGRHVTARSVSPVIGSSTPKAPQTLDLHGYTVAEAVILTAETVEIWWNKELEARHVHGVMHRFGSKADFIEPLDVVTGRGLHSVGGQAKIKSAVSRMLKEKGFLLDEDVGRVLVVGKKVK